MVTEGSWEYVERCGGMTAVVIVAEHDGKYILVEQERVPLRPALHRAARGLVGDEDDLGVEETALKELEEETGFTAERVERLGEFYSSPGMVAEGYHAGARAWRSAGRDQSRAKTSRCIWWRRATIAGFIAAKRGARAWRSTPSCCCCWRAISIG